MSEKVSSPGHSELGREKPLGILFRDSGTVPRLPLESDGHCVVTIDATPWISGARGPGRSLEAPVRSAGSAPLSRSSAQSADTGQSTKQPACEAALLCGKESKRFCNAATAAVTGLWEAPCEGARSSCSRGACGGWTSRISRSSLGRSSKLSKASGLAKCEAGAGVDATLLSCTGGLKPAAGTARISTALALAVLLQDVPVTRVSAEPVPCPATARPMLAMRPSSASAAASAASMSSVLDETRCGGARWDGLPAASKC